MTSKPHGCATKRNAAIGKQAGGVRNFGLTTFVEAKVERNFGQTSPQYCRRFHARTAGSITQLPYELHLLCQRNPKRLLSMIDSETAGRRCGPFRQKSPSVGDVILDIEAPNFLIARALCNAG
jgi:hypothetical protein